jgi:hypothetical protein
VADQADALGGVVRPRARDHRHKNLEWQWHLGDGRVGQERLVCLRGLQQQWKQRF